MLHHKKITLKAVDMTQMTIYLQHTIFTRHFWEKCTYKFTYKFTLVISNPNICSQLS